MTVIEFEGTVHVFDGAHCTSCPLEAEDIPVLTAEEEYAFA